MAPLTEWSLKDERARSGQASLCVAQWLADYWANICSCLLLCLLMAAPAHTGMWSVTAIDGVLTFFMQLHIHCALWADNWYLAFIHCGKLNIVYDTMQNRKTTCRHSMAIIWWILKTIAIDHMISSSLQNSKSTTSIILRLKFSQESNQNEFYGEPRRQRKNNRRYVLHGSDWMHCGQTAGPRGDHFKEKQLWGMGLSAQIEKYSIVMLTQDQVQLSSLIFENIPKFYNLWNFDALSSLLWLFIQQAS